MRMAAMGRFETLLGCRHVFTDTLHTSRPLISTYLSSVQLAPTQLPFGDTLILSNRALEIVRITHRASLGSMPLGQEPLDHHCLQNICARSFVDELP